MGAQVGAACCGVYGFRPSAGAVPSDGVSRASGRLEQVAWVASDPDVLYRVGQALKLPGGARLRSSYATAILRIWPPCCYHLVPGVPSTCASSTSARPAPGRAALIRQWYAAFQFMQGSWLIPTWTES